MSAAAPRWRRAPGVLWRRSLDTVIVLPPGLDEPVTLAATGPAVWEALAQTHDLDGLVELLAEAYGAAPDVVAADVVALLERLAGSGIVERDPAGAP